MGEAALSGYYVHVRAGDTYCMSPEGRVEGGGGGGGVWVYRQMDVQGHIVICTALRGKEPLVAPSCGFLGKSEPLHHMLSDWSGILEGLSC